MRRGAGLLVLLLVASGKAGAQVPRVLNYQGKLTDTSGVVDPGPRQLTFTLYDAAGHPVWSEVQPNVEIRGGVFNVLLGATEPFPVAVDFQNPYTLGIKVGAEDELPRTPLAVVPYALAAATVPDGIVDSAQIVPGSVGIAALAPGSITTTQVADGAVLTRHVRVENPRVCSASSWSGTTSLAEICSITYQATRSTSAMMIARIESATHQCGSGSRDLISMSSTLRVEDNGGTLIETTDGVTVNFDLGTRTADNSLYVTQAVTLAPGTHRFSLKARYSAPDCLATPAVTWAGPSLTLQLLGVTR